MIDHAVRFIDVVEGAIAQSTHCRIIFFAGDIVVRFIQQFHRAVVSAGPVHMRIDRRMIVQILAVVDRGALDLSNGFVDFFNGVLFLFVHVMRWRQVLQVSARVPQIAQRVQISRMPSWFVSEAYRRADGNKKRE